MKMFFRMNPRSIKLYYVGVILFSLFIMACNREDSNTVVIHTDHGDITVRLYDETVEYRKNFIDLTKSGFYDSLLFHRILPDLIIQGGDPTSKNAPEGKFLGQGDPGYTIAPDFRYVHTYGAVAGARKSDNFNPRKRSSGSQFYIVIGRPVNDEDLDRIEEEKKIKYTPEQRRLYNLVGGIPQFDNEYSVFGEVIDGMEVVKKISRLKRDANDRPVEDVLMFPKIANDNNEE